MTFSDDIAAEDHTVDTITTTQWLRPEADPVKNRYGSGRFANELLHVER